jgi:hypothetical protein
MHARGRQEALRGAGARPPKQSQSLRGRGFPPLNLRRANTRDLRDVREIASGVWRDRVVPICSKESRSCGQSGGLRTGYWIRLEVSPPRPRSQIPKLLESLSPWPLLSPFPLPRLPVVFFPFSRRTRVIRVGWISPTPSPFGAWHRAVVFERRPKHDTLPAQEPARLDLGHVKEPEQDLPRHGDATLIVRPGAKWNIKEAGQYRPAVLSEELLPNHADAIRQDSFCVLPGARVLRIDHSSVLE